MKQIYSPSRSEKLVTVLRAKLKYGQRSLSGCVYVLPVLLSGVGDADKTDPEQ